MDFAKQLDRTLVLPHWVEYRPGMTGSVSSDLLLTRYTIQNDKLSSNLKCTASQNSLNLDLKFRPCMVVSVSSE